MSRNRKRPSIKDVSNRAGVSVGTVSNVLNSPDKVKGSTRDAVEAAMAELGFVRSDAASRLRTGESNTVGVVVLDINNPFFMEAASSIERELRAEGCHMILASSDHDRSQQEKLLELFISQDVRGVILTPVDGDELAADHGVGKQFDRAGIPLVLFDHPKTRTDLPSVSVDDELGSRLAIEHLIASGHRNIGFINGPLNMRQSRSRLSGVDAAVRASRERSTISLSVVEAKRYDSLSGALAAEEILNLDPRPTAVACANDLLAIGFMRTALRRSLKIPQDISLVGFDDIEVADQLWPPLTTIRQPMEELGVRAARLVLSPEADAEDERVAPTLIVRSSVRKLTLGR